VPIGDRAYRTTVPPEAQQLASEKGLGAPNWYIVSADAPPYFPESVREILMKVAAIATSKKDKSQSAGL
jgi:hypothetical protein